MNCINCPRHCKINRNVEIGFCKVPQKIKVALCKLHFGEEPIISGANGSGTIFFSGCNMRCVFCQNYQISTTGFGKEITTNRLIKIIKNFEKQGANNINLVSPTQYSTQIIEALKIYKPQIPIVYNCNGYEDETILDDLKKYIDIYLVDFKYFDNALALKYSNCQNYFEICTTAIRKMKQFQPNDIIENGILKKGVIIRHLALPSHISDSIKILEWISDNLDKTTIVSLMSQYVPINLDKTKFPEINRKLKQVEYNVLIKKALALGFENVFIQDLSSANVIEIPSFNLSGV